MGGKVITGNCIEDKCCRICPTFIIKGNHVVVLLLACIIECSFHFSMSYTEKQGFLLVAETMCVINNCGRLVEKKIIRFHTPAKIKAQIELHSPNQLNT